jgi:conjugative relaxase-like TrwC/TraI family protein
MLTISKPLSAGQTRRYHEEEFQNARENYYTEGEVIRGVWHGQLADRWSLIGEVREEHFERLAEGQHPVTGEQLVRYQTARETKNARGETVSTMEHRAGWDATFSAPKSASLTALVGGDERVREAHRESVRVALNELELYVQARLGGNRRPETTGNAIAALFEHDSARPVNGYAAPQLHTHAVVFNLTETADGTVRPLQPRELYRTQQYATAVYRSELAARLTALGYEVERGRSGQPEIAGYSREYLDASSPRRQQIEGLPGRNGSSWRACRADCGAPDPRKQAGRAA